MILSKLNYDYVHSNTKGQLTIWVWVNAAVTVQEVGIGENMWWLVNNTPSFTSATLKIKHADTSLWLPAAKVNYMHARPFLQCCIVLSSLSCISHFVKAKLWQRKHNILVENQWCQVFGMISAGLGKRWTFTLGPQSLHNCHYSHTKQAIWIGLLISKLASVSPTQHVSTPS